MKANGSGENIERRTEMEADLFLEKLGIPEVHSRHSGRFSHSQLFHPSGNLR